MSFNVAPTRSSTAKTAKGKFTVKATSQTLVNANEDRVGIYVDNPSSKEVWLCLGTEAAVKEEGLWLKKEVGSKYIQGYSGAITCITSEGEGSIVFAEI